MTRTKLVLAGIAILLLGYEGYALLNNIPNDTISEAVWTGIAKYPIITFLAGVFCGHFFWQRTSNIASKAVTKVLDYLDKTNGPNDL